MEVPNWSHHHHDTPTTLVANNNTTPPPQPLQSQLQHSSRHSPPTSTDPCITSDSPVSNAKPHDGAEPPPPTSTTATTGTTSTKIQAKITGSTLVITGLDTTYHLHFSPSSLSPNDNQNNLHLPSSNSSGLAKPPNLWPDDSIVNDDKTALNVPRIIKRRGRGRAKRGAHHDSAAATVAAAATSKVPPPAAVPLLSPDKDTLSDKDFPSPYTSREQSLEIEEPNDEARAIYCATYRALSKLDAFSQPLTKFDPAQRSTANLYALAEHAATALRAWQDEYIALDRLTAPHAAIPRKPVTGSRQPLDTTLAEDLKESDLYDYTFDPKKLGRQDPIAQSIVRDASGRELRNRHQRSRTGADGQLVIAATASAVGSEDDAAATRRARKPVVKYDGIVASTRRKRGLDSVEQSQERSEPAAKRGRGGSVRGRGRGRPRGRGRGGRGRGSSRLLDRRLQEVREESVTYSSAVETEDDEDGDDDENAEDLNDSDFATTRDVSVARHNKAIKIEADPDRLTVSPDKSAPGPRPRGRPKRSASYSRDDVDATAGLYTQASQGTPGTGTISFDTKPTVSAVTATQLLTVPASQPSKHYEKSQRRSEIMTKWWARRKQEEADRIPSAVGSDDRSKEQPVASGRKSQVPTPTGPSSPLSAGPTAGSHTRPAETALSRPLLDHPVAPQSRPTLQTQRVADVETRTRHPSMMPPSNSTSHHYSYPPQPNLSRQAQAHAKPPSSSPRTAIPDDQMQRYLPPSGNVGPSPRHVSVPGHPPGYVSASRRSSQVLPASAGTGHARTRNQSMSQSHRLGSMSHTPQDPPYSSPAHVQPLQMHMRDSHQAPPPQARRGPIGVTRHRENEVRPSMNLAGLVRSDHQTQQPYIERRTTPAHALPRRFEEMPNVDPRKGELITRPCWRIDDKGEVIALPVNAPPGVPYPWPAAQDSAHPVPAKIPAGALLIDGDVYTRSSQDIQPILRPYHATPEGRDASVQQTSPVGLADNSRPSRPPIVHPSQQQPQRSRPQSQSQSHHQHQQHPSYQRHYDQQRRDLQHHDPQQRQDPRRHEQHRHEQHRHDQYRHEQQRREQVRHDSKWYEQQRHEQRRQEPSRHDQTSPDERDRYWQQQQQQQQQQHNSSQQRQSMATYNDRPAPAPPVAAPSAYVTAPGPSSTSQMNKRPDISRLLN